MTYLISNAMDAKLNFEIEAAMCKIYSSVNIIFIKLNIKEAAWNSCDECIQVTKICKL